MTAPPRWNDNTLVNRPRSSLAQDNHRALIGTAPAMRRYQVNATQWCLEKAMVSAEASIARVQRFKARRFRALILNMLGMPMLMAGLACGVAASENVPFEVLGGDQCYMFSQLVTTPAVGNNIVEMPLELVIDNEKDYKKLFDPQMVRQSCANVDPSKRVPDVDFAKNTVLGLWSEGSCAATGFEKKVLRDDVQKTITYSVTVLESQLSCSGPGLEGLNLIAIPKVPAGYKVFFESLRRD